MGQKQKLQNLKMVSQIHDQCMTSDEHDGNISK
jgi:hypothetical protein